MKNTVKSTVDKFSSRSELAFLIFVTIIAVWIFVGTFDFRYAGAFFPRTISGILLVLLGIIFVRRLFIAKSDVDEPDESSSYRDLDTGEEGELDEITGVKTYALLFLYLVGSYLVGFIVASGIFTFITQTFFGYGGVAKRVLMSIVVMALITAGYIVLDLSWTTGYVYDYLDW